MNNFDRFVLFHAENPHVYDLFERLALKGIAAGRRHLSAYQIFEVMRWEYSIETTEPKRNPDDPDRTLKLNNNHRPYYARLFMDKHPKREGVFRIRKIRSI